MRINCHKTCYALIEDLIHRKFLINIIFIFPFSSKALSFWDRHEYHYFSEEEMELRKIKEQIQGSTVISQFRLCDLKDCELSPSH